MTGPDIDTVLGWRGRTVRDGDGEKIGSFGDVYLDRETDRPAWGSVRTGLFGSRESLVPLDGVTERDDELVVPYARDVVKDAPNVDPDVALDEAEEARLYAHYERDYAAAGGAVAAGSPDADAHPGERVDADADAGTPGATRATAPTGDDEGATMIRSEEEVAAAHGPMRPAERVRLKKVMVTDEVRRTVPVRREVVQLEHEPPPEGEVESVEDVDRR